MIMSIRMFCLGAMALTMATGAAVAGALDEPTMMAPFYTDASMKTMKKMADFKTVWMSMSEADRASIMKECTDEGIAKDHEDFCKMTKQLGGAN
jgi:NurA-like 5'-3' nuclease